MLTGKALSSRAKFDIPDTKTYSSWETVLDRWVGQFLAGTANSVCVCVCAGLWRAMFRWMESLIESVQAFWLSVV